MRLGCGLPMGPLMLLDLIGLDTAYEILDTMYKQGRDRLHAPSPILKQMVTAGLRGGRRLLYSDPDAAPLRAGDEILYVARSSTTRRITAPFGTSSAAAAQKARV